MSLTLSNIASRVLRNCEVPEDSSTTQALADVKQYVNEVARKIWRANMWPEYKILGSYTIPADTKRFDLSDIVVDSGYNTSGNGYNASFSQILAIREGANPLMPEDAGAIQKLDPALWASTSTPVSFDSRGQQGIALHGQYSVATALSFFGKAKFQDLTDAETWILDEYGDALIEGATVEWLRRQERDDNRANISQQAYMAELNKLLHERKVQGADVVRIIPIDPWTKYFSQQSDTSKIGISDYP